MNREKQKLAIRCAPFLWEKLLPRDLPDEVVRRIRLAVLNADASETEKILAGVTIAPSLKELCFESCLLIGGKSDLLFESSKNSLGMKVSKDGIEIWRERMFLAGFAAHRTRRQIDGDRIWGQLKLSYERIPKTQQLRFDLEDGVSLMNRGLFKAALEIFDPMLSLSDTFDLYWKCRLYQCHSIACDGVGLQKKADYSLHREGELLRNFPSKPLVTNLKRVKILNEIKREHHANATALLKEAFTQADSSESARVFLNQLKLWLELSRNEVEAAESTYRRLVSYLNEARLSSDVIELKEDHCNLLLRQGNYVGAEEVAKELLLEARERRNVYLESSSNLYLAQIAFHKKDFKRAFENIEQALAIYEEQGYGTEYAVALFHAAGISFGAKELTRFKGYVLRAEKKAKELKLDKSLRCFAYLRQTAFRSSENSSAFIDILTMPDLGGEVEYYLSSYEIVTQHEFLVRGQEFTKVLPAADIRRMLINSEVILWFPEDGKLVFQGTGTAKTLAFRPESALRKTFESLLENNAGASLAFIHSLSNSSNFHPLRHSEQAKSVVKRLRQLLEDSPINIEFSRETHSYSLKCSLDILSVTLFEKHTSDQIADREKEILTFIAEKQRVTTSELREHFKISRQALHVYLKALVSRGQVRQIKRGPLSAYTL